MSVLSYFVSCADGAPRRLCLEDVVLSRRGYGKALGQRDRADDSNRPIGQHLYQSRRIRVANVTASEIIGASAEGR